MFGRSRETNIIFIIIMVLFAISNSNFNLMQTLLTLPGLILALTIHEYAHAKVSDRLGDPTPEAQGRLTLNPLAHLDPVGTVFLVFAGFGWGKPVEIDERYYRNPTRDTMLVSLAGPVSNFIQSLIWFLVLGGMNKFVPESIFISNNSFQILYTMIYYAALINLSLGVFNLLPLPPLDGSKILRYFLHGKARDILYYLEMYSTLIILVLFMTNITGKILSPIVGMVGDLFVFITNAFWGLF